MGIQADSPGRDGRLPALSEVLAPLLPEAHGAVRLHHSVFCPHGPRVEVMALFSDGRLRPEPVEGGAAVVMDWLAALARRDLCIAGLAAGWADPPAGRLDPDAVAGLQAALRPALGAVGPAATGMDVTELAALARRRAGRLRGRLTDLGDAPLPPAARAELDRVFQAWLDRHAGVFHGIQRLGAILTVPHPL